MESEQENERKIKRDLLSNLRSAYDPPILMGKNGQGRLFWKWPYLNALDKDNIIAIRDLYPIATFDENIYDSEDDFYRVGKLMSEFVAYGNCWLTKNKIRNGKYINYKFLSPSIKRILRKGDYFDSKRLVWEGFYGFQSIDVVKAIYSYYDESLSFSIQYATDINDNIEMNKDVVYIYTDELGRVINNPFANNLSSEFFKKQIEKVEEHGKMDNLNRLVIFGVLIFFTSLVLFYMMTVQN